MHNSNPVLIRILVAAGRRDVLLALEVATIQSRLEAMFAPLDQFSIDDVHGPGSAGSIIPGRLAPTSRPTLEEWT
jgi:hypothetical protein